MFKGKMPDVSWAVAMSVVGWFLAQAVAYGWIDDQTKGEFLSVTSTAVALGVKFWDAYVRGKRNEARAAEALAAANVTVAP